MGIMGCNVKYANFGVTYMQLICRFDLNRRLITYLGLMLLQPSEKVELEVEGARAALAVKRAAARSFSSVRQPAPLLCKTGTCMPTCMPPLSRPIARRLSDRSSLVACRMAVASNVDMQSYHMSHITVACRMCIVHLHQILCRWSSIQENASCSQAH